MEPLHLGLVPCPKLEIQRIIKNIVLSLEDFAVSWRRHTNEQNYHEKYMRKLLNRDKHFMKIQRNEQVNLCRKKLRRRVEAWEDGERNPRQREQHVQCHRGMEEGGMFQKVWLLWCAWNLVSKWGVARDDSLGSRSWRDLDFILDIMRTQEISR